MAYFSVGGELELYFLSSSSSAHCRNLAGCGQMAVAVFDGRQEWGEAHAGLQLFGAAGPVPGGQILDELEFGENVYLTAEVVLR